MFVNSAIPSLTDYVAFLYDVVGLKATNLPYVLSNATGGSVSTLVDTNAVWVTDQWKGYTVIDISQGSTAVVAGNTTNTLTFVTALAKAIAPGDQYLIDIGVISMTFALAMDIVNTILAVGSPIVYTLAVYNLAMDRLLNFAPDAQYQTYWQQERTKYRIHDVISGVVMSSGDNGSNTGILNPEQLKLLTLQDLQTLKTPWGRQYMAFAQMYGRDLWGVS